MTDAAAPAKTDHQKALDYLVHCINVHEQPAHSNRGPIQVNKPVGGVDFFEQHDFLIGEGYPWCVCAIQTAWQVAGRPLPYLTAGAFNLWDWARTAGWLVPLDKCIPGDPIVFEEGAGHASTLERYDASMGLVHTIDGNWDDCVMRVAHPASGVKGALGIHVPEKPPVKPPVVPKPFWVIATSHNGHRVLLFTQYATQARIMSLLPKLMAKYGKSGITITRGGVKKS